MCIHMEHTYVHVSYLYIARVKSNKKVEIYQNQEDKADTFLYLCKFLKVNFTWLYQ